MANTGKKTVRKSPVEDEGQVLRRRPIKEISINRERGTGNASGQTGQEEHTGQPAIPVHVRDEPENPIKPIRRKSKKQE